MARHTFSGTLYDLVAAPSDPLDITSPLELVPNEAVTFYDAPGGVELTDFLLWNAIDNDYTTPATSIVTDASGMLPAFQGPDGVDAIYDVGGRVLLARDASSGGGVSSYNDLTDVPSEFPPADHDHAIADVTSLQTALDAKSDDDHDHDDRYYTQTEVNDMLAGAGIGGDYPAARNVYETAGSLPTRAATGIPETTPINVILELGSTKDPFSVTYGYVPGFDRVGKTVLA